MSVLLKLGLDRSFLQTSERPTLIGKEFSCWARSICFAAVHKTASCKMCRKALGSQDRVWLQSSPVPAWKRRIKLCPEERGTSTDWWMWMGYQTAASGFLTRCPSNTQGTGLRGDRNIVWYLKEIKPSAGISWVSEHTFCESAVIEQTNIAHYNTAGCHPTLEFFAIICHIQPSHWRFTIFIEINHMRFTPKESAIKQRIF